MHKLKFSPPHNAEANVYLVARYFDNDDRFVVRVLPHWECTMPPNEVQAAAVTWACEIVEEVGYAAADLEVTVVDLRSDAEGVANA